MGDALTDVGHLALVDPETDPLLPPSRRGIEGMSARGVLGVCGSMLACAVMCPALAAQSTFQAGLSADTVDVGEVFELRVRVPVPAGSVVYFPDTVGTTEVLESHTPVRWAAEPDPAGGSVLTLTYPVM